MKKILYKLARIIFKYQGYRIALIKASKGTVIIDGDGELLKHVNIKGYFGTEKYSAKPIATKETYKEPVALKDTKDLENQIAEDIIQTLRDIDSEEDYNKSVERYIKSKERLQNLIELRDNLKKSSSLSKTDSSKGNTVSSIGVRCPNHDIDTQE